MSTKNISESDFLGTGWTFPPTFSKDKMSVEMLSGEADIKSSLEILFTTRLGERLLRSKYGSTVPEKVFEPMDRSEAVMLREDITLAILLHEPRIKPIEVKVEMDELEGRVTISIDYSIITTNNRRNFVFPFYIIEGTEVRK